MIFLQCTQPYRGFTTLPFPCPFLNLQKDLVHVFLENLNPVAFPGDTDKLVELLLDGYEHIIDISDEDNVPIIDAVAQADQPDTIAFLQSILEFEVTL